MSINFSSFDQQSYIGQPISQPISLGANLLKPTPPQLVRLSIPWASYGASSLNQQIGVSANLFAQGQTTSPLDFIRSVFIDNTFVSVPVYVQFPDTLATYLCPAYGQAMHPVFTYQQQFTIFGDGFQDGDVSQTNLFFTNIDRHGYFVPATTGGNSGAPTTPVILTRTYNLNTSSGGNVSIPSIPLGDADDDRVIAVSIATTRNPGSATNTINAVTINGVAASLRSKASTGTDPVRNTSAEIWSAAVPTGTSGPLLITTTGGGGTLYLTLSVYSMRNLSNPAPLDAQNRVSPSSGTMIAGTNCGANGILLACGEGLSSNFGWQNVQQNLVSSQVTVGTATYYGSTASLLTAQDGNVNVQMTGRALATASWE